MSPWGATGFSNIEQINGNNTASTLTGDEIANACAVHGQNDGVVNGVIFTNFNNLTGGKQRTPLLTASGAITGLVNEDAGVYAMNMAALPMGNVVLGRTFTNVEQITGNGSKCADRFCYCRNINFHHKSAFVDAKLAGFYGGNDANT